MVNSLDGNNLFVKSVDEVSVLFMPIRYAIGIRSTLNFYCANSYKSLVSRKKKTPDSGVFAYMFGSIIFTKNL